MSDPAAAVRAAALRGLVVLLVTGAAIFAGAAAVTALSARPAYSQVDQPCIPSPLCPTSTTAAPPVTESTTTVPSTTSTTITSTTVAAPSVYTVSFSPCGDTTGACDEDPGQIQLLYPAGAPPQAVEVNWEPGDRSASAPSPAATSVVLQFVNGANCGTQEQCWPWPSTLTDQSFVLNGTYQVVTCFTYQDGNCTQPDTQSIGLAVPPDPPQKVTASSSGSAVTLSWQAPSQTPPDLAGYTVSRNGTAVYTCSIDGLAAGVDTSCPSSLTVTDHPGDGSYTYTVAALRLGAAGDDLISSPAVEDGGGEVVVPGSSAGQGGSGGQTVGSSPVIGSVGTVAPSTSPTVATTPSGTATVETLPGESGQDPTVASVPQNLRYPTSDPVTGKSASALSLKVDQPPTRTDLVPAGVLALGLIVLAIAAHFLYLRVELSVMDSRPMVRRRPPA